ncbi:MAG TPA: hypothetical protein DCG38_05835 [Eubacteriaceae bacterium]|jgi:DNA-binding LytR/AlgR family response regulator|nr:hypothetical protein [Eubacteriaceae bacterium]
MIRIAICEDDSKQQNEIEGYIVNMESKEPIEINKFDSGEELVKAYEAGEKFAIILLDMQLIDIDGIQTAKTIKRLGDKSIIIIITSILEYAVEGYSIDAFDFILKPIDKEKFKNILIKAIDEIQSRKSGIYVIDTRDSILAIKLATILYIESNKRKVILHLDGKTYVNNESISDTEERLKNDGFIRISRYYLVNVSHIEQVGVNTLILTSGEELTYSVNYRDTIKKAYFDFAMGGL